MKFILVIALMISSFFSHAVNIPNQAQITYYYFNQQAYVLYDDWSYHPLGHVDTYLNNLPQCN